MQDIEMVVTSKRVKFGQEMTKRLWMRPFIDVTVHLNSISQQHRTQEK